MVYALILSHRQTKLRLILRTTTKKGGRGEGGEIQAMDTKFSRSTEKETK
jgi:hypothetical protein